VAQPITAEAPAWRAKLNVLFSCAEVVALAKPSTAIEAKARNDVFIVISLFVTLRQPSEFGRAIATELVTHFSFN
jgi:hypothetical protein